YIFLEKYCGIQLEKNYWLTSSGSVTSWTDDTTGNVDTGAITGSDAGGSTEAKTDHSIVPESFINTYTATTSKAQNIITGSRDWVVQATSYDDTITSGGADSINAGDGSDQIIANADGATITSGSGADFITISENVSDITFSDLDAEDNLTISGEFEIGSAHIEDSLLVITDSTSTRKIRLADFDTAKNAKINSTTIGDWLSNAGIDFNQLGIRNEELGIDSGANSNTTADSSRIEIDSDYTPSQVEEIISTAPTSTKDTPERCAKTSNDDFVNVNLDNVDTSTAGNVSVDGAVVGQLSSTFPNASTFTRNGLTIHLLGVTSDTSGSTDNIQAKTLDELTDDQRTIIAGLFKWWAKECLTLNEESYGISFNSSTTMIKDIGLYFYDSQGSGNTLASVWNTQRKTQDGFATELFLSINMNYYENISSDDMDGTSSKSSAGFLDRTLAHEFNHAVMAANINFFGQLPKFIKEGFAELTHGIDDERGNTIFKIAYDADALDASLDLTDSNTSSQTVGDSYSGGYMFLRYFAKQAANETLPAFGEITATVNLSSDGDYYISGNSTSETASNAAQTIKLGTLSNGIYTVDDSGVHQVINASSAVKIVGLTSNDIFNGSNGADTVETSEGSNIITGAGNDSVKLYGQYATINTGAGNDTLIIVDGSHHSINLGDGNNLVSISTTYSHSNSIFSGNGSDTIKDSGMSESYIFTGGGNDSIIFGGSDNSIFAGDGNDSVKFQYSNLNNNYINLGAGDDYVTLSGTGNSIIGGAGNDTFYQYNNSAGGNFFIFNSSSGNDLIRGLKANDTIIITGDYSSTKSDNDIIVTANDGKITLQGAASLSTVNIESKEENPMLITLTEGNDTYSNTVEGATIQALGGDDNLENSGANVLIIAGNDNDSVYNGDEGSDVTISGGAGSDTIDNWGLNFLIDGGTGNDVLSNNPDGDGGTILGGEGDDSIYNREMSNRVSINAGDGDDTIENYGANVTISGGAGNDSIYGGDYEGVYIQYASGDGNDSILGFNETSTLQIGGGTYSSQTSGDDIIITVGEGSILLQGAASLSVVNIDGEEEVANPKWSINGARAIYGTSNETLIAVEGISDDAKDSNFYISGNKVTIGKAAVKTDGTAVTLLTDGYTLKLGKGMTASETLSAATYDASTMTLNTKGTTAGYNLSSDKKSISYTSGTSKEFQFSGIADGATASNFYISGKTITIAKVAVQTNGTPVKLLT
ncbi:MAG: calcium-binding protein, partial [Selenomonadaceae bacterium]|nr:calcium-binding protein [Selenomonadaceae bacterium]